MARRPCVNGWWKILGAWGSEATNCLDRGGSELTTEPRDEYLDRVGVAVAILRVDVFDQLRLCDDAVLVVHQVRENYGR